MNLKESILRPRMSSTKDWVAVKEPNSSYYFGGTVLITIYQDLPCTLNWGYMVPNSRYLGPNRG